MCCNILKIKNILFIGINLSLFKENTLSKNVKMSQFSSIFLDPQSLSFPTPPNSQPNLKKMLTMQKGD